MVVTTITRRYHFEAAHFLPNVPEGHKCRRLHGHNYVVEITVGGKVGQDGFIMDFWDLDKIVDKVVAPLDHRLLNEIQGLENPTAENIALFFLDLLHLNGAVAVKCFETSDCWATAAR